MSKITCMICGKQFNSINNTHLKSHSMTFDEYRSKFPEALTISTEISQKLSINAKKINANRDYSMIGEKISKTKKKKFASGDLVIHNKGKKNSDEQNKKLSEIMTKKYKLGEILHWNSGRSTPEDVRNKISLGLRTNEKMMERRTERRIRIALEKERRNREKIEKYRENAANVGLILVELDETKKMVTLECQTCNHVFKRTKQYVETIKSKFAKCRICYPPPSTSKAQLEIFDFIKSLGVDAISEDRTVLCGKEIDILIPSKNIGFEYNGIYHHAERVHDTPNNHLLWKQQFAHKKGIRLIHIFEDEWKFKRDIVESRIKHLLNLQEIKIYARKCDIREITSRERDEFLNDNHLQGKDVSKIRYGLFFKNELVSVMTFKPVSYIKGMKNKSMWELNRFSSKRNMCVVGAASRLFRKFVADHKPEAIVSYADRRWNTGTLYLNLGFKYSHSSPPSYWYMKNYQVRIHRSKFMKHTLIEKEEDKNKTEWELMMERNYDRIWDCGAMVYHWIK